MTWGCKTASLLNLLSLGREPQNAVRRSPGAVASKLYEDSHNTGSAFTRHLKLRRQIGSVLFVVDWCRIFIPKRRSLPSWMPRNSLPRPTAYAPPPVALASDYSHQLACAFPKRPA